jgi:hypothetical protein
MSDHMPILLMAMVLAALSTAADAQLIKCTEPNGKVTYTDRGCSSTAAESRVSGNPNVIEAPEVRRALAARKQAEVDAAVSSGAQAGGNQGNNEPRFDPAADAQRIRELQMIIGSQASASERKRAAREELDRITRGNNNRMSPEEQQRAARLNSDLASIDDEKRQRAARQLRDLNDKYESKDFLDNRAKAEEARKQRQAALNALTAANAAATARAAAQANANAQQQVILNGRPMAPAAGGFVDPQSGTFYQGVAGGYVNSQNGQFVPKP